MNNELSINQQRRETKKHCDKIEQEADSCNAVAMEHSSDGNAATRSAGDCKTCKTAHTSDAVMSLTTSVGHDRRVTGQKRKGFLSHMKQLSLLFRVPSAGHL